MHERPAEEFFHRGADVVRGMEDDNVKRQGVAYLLGFLCHFVLDSTCHGYIEKKIHVSGLSHTEIEVEFDRALFDPGQQRSGSAVVNRSYSSGCSKGGCDFPLF